jgi:hypothetical protein
VRIIFPWHFNPKYPISPPVLNNTISLLNKDLLGFHLLKLLNGFLGLFKLLPFVSWHSQVLLLPFIEALYRFLCFLSAVIKCSEFLTFLVEGNVVEDALTSEGRHVVSSQETRRLLPLLIYVGFLDLLGTREGDESGRGTHISKNLRDLI